MDITERKLAEEALRESEQRLSQIINFLPDATMAVDSEGRVIAWNRAMEEMTGVPAGEMIGKRNHEYALPFYGTRRPILLDLVLAPNEEMRQAYSLFTADKDVLTVEAENATPLGKNAILWAKAAPLLDANGMIVGAIETIRDVTDRKLGEKRIQRQGELVGAINLVLRDALESETDADIARTCLRMAEEISDSRFGFIGELNEAGRLDTLALSDPGWKVCRIPESDSPSLIRNMEIRGIWGSVLKGEQSLIINDPASHPDSVGVPDGHPSLTSFVGVPLKRSGKTFGLIALANKEGGYDPSDVGDVEALSSAFVQSLDRKRAERALHDSEEKYRRIFENSIEGIFQSTPGGRLLTVNSAFSGMLGYASPEEMINEVTDIARQLYPTREGREATKRRLGESVPLANYEVELLRKDGTSIWVSLNARAIRDESGGVIYYEGLAEDITARRKTEEALRRSESLLKEAQKVAHIGHWEIDSPIGTPTWSEEIFHIFGLDPVRSEPSFAAHQDLIHSDDWELLHGSVTRGTTEGIPFDIEFRCIRPDKSIRWMNAKGYTTGKREGGFFGMFGTAQDITEMKEAQDALRANEEQYRAVFDNAGLGIDLLDRNGKIVKMNKALLNILGYSEEELRQLTFLDITHPDDRETSKRNLEALVAGEVDYYRLEKRYLRKDGGIFWGNLSTSAIRDANGKHAGTVGVIEDITERKQAEQASKASETRYRRLFEAAKDGILILDSDTAQIVDVNPFLIDLLGYSREELVEKKLWEIGIIEDIGKCRALFAELQGKEYVSYEDLPLQKKGGSNVEVEFVSNIYLVNGNKVIQCNIRDITERKRLERQLLQAQKMEAIGTLAGGIAHDFNNILTVVLGFSDLLLAQKDEKDPDYEDLRKILRAGKNGAELVQRLLMFSRKSEPKPIPINLNKQIVQFEKLLRRSIPRMIYIQLDLSADLPEINADPSQVEQVLMNLAVNARDSMPDNGKLTFKTEAVTLDEAYCRLHVEAKARECVLLSVSDTGHGMDKATLQHIFEPFFTTKEVGRGTGLGLAMVYGIVKQHNGHITVYSEVGKGTTFRVYLPAIEGEVETHVDTTAIMPAFGTETVLLVDDEDLVSDLGARILTKHGYTVLKAANGREALDLFKKERSQIALVILDLIMPEMGGTECLKELLEIDPQVKVLVASGYSADASAKEMIQMGAKGFVSKPFRVKEILRDVRRVLDEG